MMINSHITPVICDDSVIIIKNFIPKHEFHPDLFTSLMFPLLLCIIIIRCIVILMSSKKYEKNVTIYAVSSAMAFVSLLLTALLAVLRYMPDNIQNFILIRIMLIITIISAGAGIGSFSVFSKIPLRLRVLFPSFISCILFTAISDRVVFWNHYPLLSGFKPVLSVNSKPEYLCLHMLILTAAVNAVCIMTERFEPSESFSALIKRSLNFIKQH